MVLKNSTANGPSASQKGSLFCVYVGVCVCVCEIYVSFEIERGGAHGEDPPLRLSTINICFVESSGVPFALFARKTLPLTIIYIHVYICRSFDEFIPSLAPVNKRDHD